MYICSPCGLDELFAVALEISPQHPLSIHFKTMGFPPHSLPLLRSISCFLNQAAMPRSFGINSSMAADVAGEAFQLEIVESK